jgi:hypothetical protein
VGVCFVALAVEFVLVVQLYKAGRSRHVHLKLWIVCICFVPVVGRRAPRHNWKGTAPAWCQWLDHSTGEGQTPRAFQITPTLVMLLIYSFSECSSQAVYKAFVRAVLSMSCRASATEKNEYDTCWH